MRELLVTLTVALAACSAAPDAQEASPGKQVSPSPILRSAAEKQAMRLFDSFDSNKDGVLDWDEWQKTQNGNAQLDLNAKRSFVIADTNQDKKLEKQEMVEWQLRVFDCFDENRDGSLTKNEADHVGAACAEKVGGISDGTYKP